MKLDDQIKRINDKLQLILSQFLFIKKENEKLKQELNQLKLIDTEKNSQVARLLQKVEILQATKSEMSEDEKRAFEKRINHYLKEVEKCISLLQE